MEQSTLTNEDFEVFHDSYERCCADPAFLDVFYEELLTVSTEIAHKFKNTDFERQKRVLKASILIMMTCASGIEGSDCGIDRIAKAHDRNHADIPPELYPIWLNSLVTAVKLCDPKYQPNTGVIWRKMMKAGIQRMIALY